MRLIIEDTQENAGRWAARYIVEQINKKQAAGGTFVLGLPTQKRTSHGMILGENGEKMSKSRGNVVNPDDIVILQNV